MNAARPSIGPHLARAAVLTGASTFVPIPFLDDVVLTRARKALVASLLQHHGRTYDVADVAPLYEDPSGSWLALPFKIAGKLVLVPVRMALRTVFVVFQVRAVALEVGKTLLLGATIDRLLAAGDLDGPPRTADAAAIRAAFEATFAGVDRRAVVDVGKRVLKAVKRAAPEGFVAAAVDASFLDDFSRRFDAARTV